mmetsp:Transcript_4882/g.14235  ORF Transcript_4882/g.14235 Transcript_4882/m.14235 type:complete len:433 (+) Transcript_4882:62-1360(+)
MPTVLQGSASDTRTDASRSLIVAPRFSSEDAASGRRRVEGGASFAAQSLPRSVCAHKQQRLRRLRTSRRRGGTCQESRIRVGAEHLDRDLPVPSPQELEHANDVLGVAQLFKVLQGQLLAIEAVSVVGDLRPVPVRLLAHVLILMIQAASDRGLPLGELGERHVPEIGAELLKHALDVGVDAVGQLLVALDQHAQLEDIDMLGDEAEHDVSQLLLRPERVVDRVLDHLPQQHHADALRNIRNAILVRVQCGMIRVARNGIAHPHLYRPVRHDHARLARGVRGEQAVNPAGDLGAEVLGRCLSHVAHDEQLHSQALLLQRRQIRLDLLLVNLGNLSQELLPVELVIRGQGPNDIHSELVGCLPRRVGEVVRDLPGRACKLLGAKRRRQHAVESLQDHLAQVGVVAVGPQTVAVACRVNAEAHPAILEVFGGCL